MTCSCLPHAAAAPTSGQTSAPSDFSMHVPLLLLFASRHPCIRKGAFCFSYLRMFLTNPGGEVSATHLAEPEANASAASSVVVLTSPCALTSIPPALALCTQAAVCGKLQFVCVRPQGWVFLEPPQANLKPTAWKTRLPFGPFASAAAADERVADRGQRRQDGRRIRCIIIPRP